MINDFNFDGIKGYELDNGIIKVRLLELGACVYSLEFAGRNIVLNFDNAAAYMESGCYLGAIVGRYANRIAGARFSIDGISYSLNANNGENTLHGGEENQSLHKRLWQSRVPDENSVCFSILSPDGDNGFPGNIEINVVYSIDGSRFNIDMTGTTDKVTAFGPTTHTYFNLDGAETINDTKVWINADSYLEPDDKLIPTGRILPAEGSFDFSSLREINGSYDHCFVLKGEKAMIAEAGDIRMTIETDLPGIQLYTGDYLDMGLNRKAGFAAEPEFFPDSPNHPEFPFEFLKPGEKMTKHINYIFEKI